MPTPEGEVKDTKTYAFKFVLEKDKWDDEPDELAVWHVYCPLLVDRGASTWGYTKEEAIKNIHEVTQMTIESMLEHNEKIPEESSRRVGVSDEPFVAVTV